MVGMCYDGCWLVRESMVSRRPGGSAGQVGHLWAVEQLG